MVGLTRHGGPYKQALLMIIKDVYTVVGKSLTYLDLVYPVVILLMWLD